MGDWTILIPGAVISAVITAIATVIGWWIRKSTSVDTANIDDRGKFTRDLLHRIETMEAEIKELRRRETRVVKIISFFGAEMRVLSNLITALVDDLHDENADKKNLLSQAGQIKTNLDNLTGKLEKEIQLFIDDPTISAQLKEDFEEINESKSRTN